MLIIVWKRPRKKTTSRWYSGTILNDIPITATIRARGKRKGVMVMVLPPVKVFFIHSGESIYQGRHGGLPLRTA
jgi:hypothetical protein